MSGKNDDKSRSEVMGRNGANSANGPHGGGPARRDWGRATRALAATAEAELAAVGELLERAARELEREPGGYVTLVALGDGRSERKVGRLDGEDREYLDGWFESVVEEAWEEAGEGAKLRLRLWGPGGKPAGSASFAVGDFVEEEVAAQGPKRSPGPRIEGPRPTSNAVPAPCSNCGSLNTKLAERGALIALLEKEVMTLRRDAERWRAQYERIAEPYRRLHAEHAALRREVDEAAAQLNAIVGGEPEPRTAGLPTGTRVARWVGLARRAG